jgi:hypothetical protein
MHHIILNTFRIDTIGTNLTKSNTHLKIHYILYNIMLRWLGQTNVTLIVIRNLWAGYKIEIIKLSVETFKNTKIIIFSTF